MAFTAKLYSDIEKNGLAKCSVLRETGIWKDQPLEIRATVSDDSSLSRVLVHYRPTRQAMEYCQVDMQPAEDGVLSATIPGEVFTPEFDLIYFVEAIDEHGNGTFYPDPDLEDPHLVVEVQRPN